MIGRFFLVSLTCLLLFSCSEEKKSFFKKESVQHSPFLLSMQHYFSDVEDEVSFPIWFDDSIVKRNRIKFIKRNIYALNQDTTSDNFPRIQKIYSFDENGELTRLEIIEHYERTKVHHVTFDYGSVKDENGYAAVDFDMKNHLMDEESTYTMHDVEQYAKNFLVYKNRDNGNYLFFMTDEKHRGPLSVESFVHPTPNDWVVLGTPKTPEKRYQVQNRVNESSVMEIKYVRGVDQVEAIHFERSPFNYKRTIQYDKKGLCTGFIDSTFSLDQFLMRRSSTFTSDSNHLPSKIVHESEKGDGSVGNRQLETFEYGYYK